MAEWIAFSQYEGFSILDDATKIRTPEGEFDLRPGKLFYFINPNTGVKNFAKPDVLLARAKKDKKAPKIKEPKAKAISSGKLPKTSLPVEIVTIGRDAVIKAIDTGCTLYYKTDKWGWQENKWDPKVILEALDHPVESDEPPLWFVHRFGIEN